ncbi:MAG TPA: DNA repair protein RecO, partial [Anseongella sp.]|nr:DNA repair protein RecO [Anseongella sp.]
MLHKTRGIVLKTTDYGDSSIIAQVFTEKLGLQSYLVNGIKKPKSRISLNVLQPLHLLEMVVYQKNTVSVQRARDIRNQPVFLRIPLDISKSTVTLFLCEVLYKVLRQQPGEDVPLFGYIFNSMELLDHQEGSPANFHLLFLMGLTRYLGFFPDTRMAGYGYFDLQNGRFMEREPLHPWYIGPPLASRWKELAESSYEYLGDIKISPPERQQLVKGLLEYYSLHVEGFGKVRSYEIL